MIRRIGFVGVGHLASFLIEGLGHRGLGHRGADRGADLELVLSPRNAERSADLAARCGAVVAPDNQAVADAADLVVLATRPADAVDAARSIDFRPGQTVISVVASLTCSVLRPAVAPADLVRAMPISCAAIGQSPTVLYPDHAAAREFLARVGQVHVLTEESQFFTATAIAAFYGWMYDLLDRASAWAAEHGLPPETARSLVLETVRGTANLGLAHPEKELSAMLDALATPGGLTEHGLRVIDERGGMDAWVEALDAIRRRLADA